MENIKPVKISKIEEAKLKIVWSDGIETDIEMEKLRENCPCAHCTTGDKGKSKLDKWLESSLKEKRFLLQKIEPVGNYALKLSWGDGHDTGLYRYEHLREIALSKD